MLEKRGKKAGRKYVSFLDIWGFLSWVLELEKMGFLGLASQIWEMNVEEGEIWMGKNEMF